MRLSDPPSAFVWPIAVVLCSSFAASTASAMLFHPASHRHVSDDGRYVLVFVSPLPVEEDAGHSAFDANEIRSIRARYASSGLYRNDGSTTPLWTIPYHDPGVDVYIAPDGKHVVAEDWNTPRQLTFYASGTMLRRVYPFELDPYLRLKLWMGRYLVEIGPGRLDAKTLRLTVPTSDGEMVFDATTGKLVSNRSIWALYVNGTLAGVLVVAIGLAAFAVLRARRRASPDDRHR